MNEEFSEIQRLFKLAEDKLKEVERISNAPLIPTINELRYAGFHILQYLQTGEKDELRKAENHCKRGLFDAHEFHIGLCIERIKKFDDDYRLVPVTSVVKDYPDCLAQARKAREFIKHSLNEHSSREEQYLEAERHAKSLEACAEKLDDSRSELNKVLRDRRQTSSRWVIGALIAIPAMTVALMKVVSHIFGGTSP